MAEWVEYGSLQGPQGPKGDDAMLPEGGTEGQFLKKTATGEEWSDVPAPDMSGYVKYSSEADKLTYDDGTEVTSIIIGDVNSQPYLQMNSNQVGIASRTLNQSAGFGIHETSHSPSLYLGANQGTTPKSVTGITDSISDSPEGLNLATDKAVADYVTAHAGDALPEGGTDGQVLTKTADGEAWEDAPEPDVSHLLNADVENATAIDPRSVDITTLAPGTYRVTKGAYVDNGEAMGTGVNGTQFPDAMIQMSEYDSDTVFGILNVYLLDADTEYGLYELIIFRAKSSGGYDFKTYAYGKKPSIQVMSDSWKLQYPTDISISNYISANPSGNALTTEKAVADYVAANAGGGGLELLWEGNGSSFTVSNYGDYALFVVFGLYRGSYRGGVLNPSQEVQQMEDAYISRGPTGIFSDPDLDFSFRKVYGLKASGGGGQ